MELEKIVADMAKAIVDTPDAVKVTRTDNESDGSIELVLTVAPDETGMVIGRHGKIAKAIRTVVKAASAGSGKKVTFSKKTRQNTDALKMNSDGEEPQRRRRYTESIQSAVTDTTDPIVTDIAAARGPCRPHTSTESILPPSKPSIGSRFSAPSKSDTVQRLKPVPPGVNRSVPEKQA